MKPVYYCRGCYTLLSDGGLAIDGGKYCKACARKMPVFLQPNPGDINSFDAAETTLSKKSTMKCLHCDGDIFEKPLLVNGNAFHPACKNTQAYRDSLQEAFKPYPKTRQNVLASYEVGKGPVKFHEVFRALRETGKPVQMQVNTYATYFYVDEEVPYCLNKAGEPCKIVERLENVLMLTVLSSGERQLANRGEVRLWPTPV